ncbi:MAG TPA: alpha/beta fold hydrolase, partial [Bryobacteraceae bacterium]
IHSETFGERGNTPVLLIMGASASMLWWPDEFCARLAAARRFVMRYDHRDTGESTCYPPGAPGYSLDDMADDALRVLDRYGIGRVHVVGMSLGGIIGQMLAIRTPERVATLTLIASTPFGPEAVGLPPFDPKILEYHKNGATVDWNDREAVVNYMANGWALLSGSAHPVDMAMIHAIAEREVTRSRNLPSMFNHALLKGGTEVWGRLQSIKTPTLIMHGTEDPVLPFPHGEALARAIHGARFIPFEGMGHELHPNDWDRMLDEIVSLTGGTSPKSL